MTLENLTVGQLVDLLNRHQGLQEEIVEAERLLLTYEDHPYARMELTDARERMSRFRNQTIAEAVGG